MNQQTVRAALNLSIRQGFEGLNYSDGADVERHILETILRSKDRSVFSVDLAKAISDWPQEYHLSRRRHCLIRPLGIKPGDRVLELGCGCGAITRYLAELGAQVTAIEGSLLRAQIAAERCKSFDNVKVVADNITKAHVDGTFDWVLLVGVLEYAPVFSDAANPADDYLQMLSRYLSKEGKLVVAIENKLGLKYFNGCGEDHLGTLFSSLQNLYDIKQPRTYGRKELISLLNANGFGHVDLWLPFPDYKLPQVLISPEGLADPQFRSEELLATLYARDYTGRMERLFLEPLVARELCRNALLPDLSNSFLAIASRHKPSLLNTTLAVTYAVDRQPEFATETRFVRKAESIVVHKAPLFPELSGGAVAGKRFRHVCETTEYVSGPLLLWRLTEARAKGAGAEQIVSALAPWFEFLLAKARYKAQGDRLDLSSYRIDGIYQDCTPFNLVESHGGLVFIDQEWHFTGEVDLGWVVARSVASSLVAFPGFEAEPVNLKGVIVGLCARHGIKVRELDIQRWLDDEVAHQTLVGGFEVPRKNPESMATRLVSDQTLEERDAQLCEVAVPIERAQADVPGGDDAIAHLKAEIDDLTDSLEERNARLQGLIVEIERMQTEVRNEQYTVLKPVYRNAYRLGGLIARSMLPGAWVERLRTKVPDPMALSKGLTYRPSPPSQKLAALESITPAAEGEDIFLLSIINWDFRTQRPQHLARGLAKRHRVFFVEMELDGANFGVRELDTNLYVLRLPSKGIGHVQPYTGKPTPSQVRQWLLALQQFCDQIQSTAFKYVIIQHPFWWQFARHLSPEFRIVVDCLDDISGFSNTKPFLLELEQDMLKTCDQLVVSSQYLASKYNSLKASKLVRNGCELLHFSSEGKRELPRWLVERDASAQGRKIRIGYVGAIAEWFDVELIAEVAKNELAFEFHLCGAVSATAPASLSVFENVIMYGEIPYTDAPAFLEAMDVLIIPFRLLPIIHACDPVKFYEYSAMGKPTVCTRLPELERVKHLAFFASTSEEFASQVRAAVKWGGDPDFQAELRAFAQDNTWDDRVAQFEGLLSQFPRVSVVILSYGDPKWTEATLYSLHERGLHYPNMEIIVVDNGSKPEDLAEVRRQAERYPGVTMIENGANLGFAKGNNVGIRAATGRYVLLLNNDTYVAPGAIHAMVQHLERNPKIGAVGPLTNNIGNEAKLVTEYADMAEMKRIARKVTTGYRGRHTPIRVLAYFAVMFRRGDLDAFGLLPEEYGVGMFEDDDHCARIRSKGYVCALAEDAFVHHHLSATFSTISPEIRKRLFEENKTIFEAKWGEWIPHEYRLQRPLPSTE